MSREYANIYNGWPGSIYSGVLVSTIDSGH